MMYEAVLLFGVIFLASFVFDTLTQSRSGLMLRHARQVVVFIAIGIYFVTCWRLKGQTLPMKTWHIRLVDTNGAIPSVPRLISRYVLAWIMPLLAALAVLRLSHATGYSSTDLLIVFAPFAGFIWAWFDRDNQFLHDRALGMRLISVPGRVSTSV